ncbi:hypothetical protein B0H10DRAFT_1944002 [Mycena sp. CBHHK59/15]|nr:hypothetical protein B0H10DRAFT_1944002 [Mycena sp. CBHHK59/15]
MGFAGWIILCIPRGSGEKASSHLELKKRGANRLGRGGGSGEDGGREQAGDEPLMLLPNHAIGLAVNYPLTNLLEQQLSLDIESFTDVGLRDAASEDGKKEDTSMAEPIPEATKGLEEETQSNPKEQSSKSHRLVQEQGRPA